MSLGTVPPFPNAHSRAEMLDNAGYFARASLTFPNSSGKWSWCIAQSQMWSQLASVTDDVMVAEKPSGVHKEIVMMSGVDGGTVTVNARVWDVLVALAHRYIWHSGSQRVDLNVEPRREVNLVITEADNNEAVITAQLPSDTVNPQPHSSIA